MLGDLIDNRRPRDLALLAVLAWGPLSALFYPWLRVGDPAWVTFDRVWISAIGLWLLYDLVKHRDRPRSRASDLVALAAAVFVVTFGLRAAATPEDRLTVVKVWFDAIALPVVLLLAARQLISSMAAFRLLAGSLAVTGGLLALTGLAQFAFDFELASRSGGTEFYDRAIDLVRVSGPYANAETLSLSLLVCYAATLCWARLRGDGLLSVPVGLAALQLAGIGVTFFRAGWLAAVLVTVCVLALPIVRSRPRPAVVGGVLLGLALLAFGLTRFDAVSTRVGNSENVTGRVATWGQDLKVFATAPVFGVGVERFTSATDKETAVVVSDVESFDQPHSSYLGLLAEQGVVGFIPFFALSVGVWWVMRAMRRTSPDDEEMKTIALAVLGAGLAYLLMSLTLTMLISAPSNAFMALLLGAAMGLLDRLSPDRGEERNSPSVAN